MDRAILRYGSFPGWGARLGEFQVQHPKLDELPFDYNRRCSSVLVGDEACNLLIVKGSAASAIDKLDALHVRSKVLTGDQKSVAVSICRRLGIDTTAVLTGEALDQLTDNELPVCVERCTVFAKLSPETENAHRAGLAGQRPHGRFSGRRHERSARHHSRRRGYLSRYRCRIGARVRRRVAAQKRPERAGSRHFGRSKRLCQHDKVYQDHRVVQLRQYLFHRHQRVSFCPSSL